MTRDYYYAWKLIVVFNYQIHHRIFKYKLIFSRTLHFQLTNVQLKLWE